MRPSAAQLVRIIPRKALDPAMVKVVHAPPPQIQELQQPTLLDLLHKQRIKAGADWPANIRVEPVIKKAAFKPVHADVRTQLKKLLKER